MKQPFQTFLNQVGFTALVTASLLSGTVQAADNNDHLKSAIDQQAKLLMNEHNISYWNKRHASYFVLIISDNRADFHIINLSIYLRI